MKIQLRPIDKKKALNNNLKIHKLALFNPKVKKVEPKSKEVEVEDISQKLLPVVGSAKFAFIIHNFLSPEECADLVKDVEASGFEEALINTEHGQVLAEDIRKCGRNIIEDEALAEHWYQRMLKVVEGTRLKEKLLTAPWTSFDPEVPGPVQAVGLNERLRFLKYVKGDRFAPHLDQSFVRGPEFGDREGEASYVTFIIFLSNVKKGGQLRFLEDESGNRKLEVNPTVGSVAIFDHNILHEGSEILSGCKYAGKWPLDFFISQLSNAIAK